MAAPTITFIGNLAWDPELKFTASGKPVLNGRILNTPRKKTASGDWEDAETISYDFNLWGDKAEAAAEVLTKGAKVIAVGRLQTNAWESKEGERRSKTIIVVDEIGLAVKSNGAANGYAPKAFQGGSDDDPWATNGAGDGVPF